MKPTITTNIGMTMLVAAGLTYGQERTTGLVSFAKFLESTENATPMHVRGPESKVRGSAEFQSMQRYLLEMYRGVQVKHSFVSDGNHFDCLPIEQQPSVRMLGLEAIATPPDEPEQGASEPAKCETGSIPMRRVTLDEMTRHATLRDFLNKHQDVAPAAASGEAAPAASAPSHKYAYMEQRVDNLGGSSTISIWRPYVNTAMGEVFSLSQEWYVGGSGAATQTAEVGWQNFPAKYGSQNSVLFIYWTADNYTTSGCYNLDCPGFVQISSAVTLGATFGEYSTAATKYEFTARFYLYKGNWWLSINGTWVGYYPGALYRGGQMSKHAQVIQFGTESVGNTVWPAQGSGYWPSSPNSAAYQKNVFYADTNATLKWASLTARNPSPACYATAGPYSDNSNNGSVYFFAGGPGGAACQ